MLKKIPNGTLKVPTSSLRDKGNNVKKYPIYAHSCAWTDGRPDGRGVSQYPRFFFKKRGDKYVNTQGKAYTHML